MDLAAYVTLALGLVFANAQSGGVAERNKRNFPVRRSTNLLLDNFHVNANTIIRTQDSRKMGANYLNETDRSSNEECLRWCFETPKCNVAVYKEKNHGSCYLFDCGSPDDFRCKFTTHMFYTSSILKLDRDSYDFSQVKHERELASLRRTTTLPPEMTTMKVNVPTPAITPSRLVTQDAAPSQAPSCHHYQFACPNSSDCIAIYNVCDGIPQCPDGSDEGKDLHCPGTDHRTSTMSTPTISSRPSPPPVLGPVENKARPGPYDYRPVNNDPKIDQGPPTQQVWDSQRSNAMQPEEYGPREGDVAFGGGSGQGYSPQRIFSNKHSNFVAANNPYHTGGGGGGSGYPNGQWADYYNEPYDGRESDYIRYHNYGGYHRPDTRPPTAFDHYKHPPGHYWPQDDAKYGPKSEVADDSSRSQWLPPTAPRQEAGDMYPARYAETAPPAGPFREQAPKPTPRKSISSLPAPDDSAYQAEAKLPNHTLSPPSTMGTAPEMPTTVELTTKAPSHGASHPSFAHRIAAEDGSPSVSELQQAGRVHAHESNSAVLALTLGLCVTALLLVLVGCRMKSIRRRLARRGRSSLAHDADYLVNGMYL